MSSWPLWVFDLDGTLVDSVADIARALRLALADHASPACRDDQVREWIGGGARDLVARAAPPALAPAVLASFQRHYHDTPVRHTRLYPGLAEVLDRLHAGGRRLAVLSNKPDDLTQVIVGRLLARWPLAAVWGQRPGRALKPAPEPARALAAACELDPARCVLIGDAPTDVACARAAGMAAVAVSWGYRPRAELVAAGPDAVVDTPAELLALAAP